MTTIFSNNEDIDSEVLRDLFTSIPDNNIIELTYSMELDGIDWMEMVDETNAWEQNCYNAKTGNLIINNYKYI